MPRGYATCLPLMEPSALQLSNALVHQSFSARLMMTVDEMSVIFPAVCVPVNGAMIALPNLHETLRPFCVPALFRRAGGGALDLSCHGSALLARHRGRNIALLTRHQLLEGDALQSVAPGDFTIVVAEEGGRALGITPNGRSFVKINDPGQAKFQDLLLLEYDDRRGDRDMRQHFLEIDGYLSPHDVKPSQVKTTFALGYPSFATDYDPLIEEDGTITGADIALRWVKLYLAESAPAPLDPENRRPMIQDERADQETIEPDGMSGAPAFFVWADETGQMHLGFSGMITHARERRYMVYEAANLRQILNSFATDS